MSNHERIRWDRRYREIGLHDHEPCDYLPQNHHILPTAGRALDVAGGAGRNALWLAARGLEVTIVDISAEGVRLAEERARHARLRVCTEVADLESESLPPGPWQVIVDCYFLSRSLISSMVRALACGGYFVMVHPTRRNLERHASPSARFLLEDGELRRIIDALDGVHLEVLDYHEGWQSNGRHEARLVARRQC